MVFEHIDHLYCDIGMAMSDAEPLEQYSIIEDIMKKVQY